MIYYLQNRWVPEGKYLRYYGLRNRDNMFCNRIKPNKKQRQIIRLLPKELSSDEKNVLGRLLGAQIVPENELRRTPKSFSEARFCSTCCANDFLIPDIEFDENGQCPICQTQKETSKLKSVVPIVADIPRSEKSRFDAAVFYTGGKDSTYLLYYLAKVKKLRVIALTWEIPFISDTARKSIGNAKKKFENVEFITCSVCNADLKKIYTKLYSLSGNTCACPSLAYILFYPELVANRVPYFFVGNEPVQMLGLYYNHLAPKLAYSFSSNIFLKTLINIGRVLTLRPPLRLGQFHTLMTMKQLAYGDNFFKKISGYSSELVSNVVDAINEVPGMLSPLRRSIRRSSRTGNIPAFVHLDFDEISGGEYDWNKVRDILVNECGWIAPDDDNKALHTSCRIEKCKDWSQFIRFYNCESTMIPFSSIEIALASRKCGRSREESVCEMENLLGVSLDPPTECAIMRGFINK